MGRRPYFVRASAYAPDFVWNPFQIQRANANGIKLAPAGSLKKYQL